MNQRDRLESKYIAALLITAILLTLTFLSPSSTKAVNNNSIERTGLSVTADDDKVIQDIEVRGLSRMLKEELIYLLGYRVGERFNTSELRSGIRRVFSKGLFNDIKVYTEPADAGIKLIYEVMEIPFVESIVVKGNEEIHTKKIKEVFYFKSEDKFEEELLEDKRLELVEFYKRRGFFKVQISAGVDIVDKEKSLVNITLDINEGIPSKIMKLDVSKEVRYVMSLTEGSLFDLDLLEEDTLKIVEYYKGKKYINPDVGPFKFKAGVLSIPVVPGPKLEIYFKNNEYLTDKELEKELLFIENGDVNDELVSEAVERIRKLYEKEGYPSSQVAAALERHNDTIEVTFVVFEGEKVFLKKISFTGITISPDALRRVIPIEEGVTYNAGLLNDSMEAIERFYNALGYLKARVVEIKEEYNSFGQEVKLNIVIKEGTQTKIGSVKISGNYLVDTKSIKQAVRHVEGTPYNEIDIRDARHSLLQLYSNRGFLDVSVDVESKSENEVVDMLFRVKENKPSVVGRIIVRGNHKTKLKIIRREIALSEGDPYSREDIEETKRKLYQLGIFREISLQALEPELEKNGYLVRDMLVSLKEGKAGSVEFTVGYGDYERLRGGVDIRYRNLGGYNRQVGFRSELSSVEEKYIFNFREPWLFNWPDVPLKVFLIRENKRAVNIETRDVLYKILKQSLIVGVEKELARGVKAGLDYEYSFTDTSEVKSDVILSKEDSGTLGIGSFSPSLFYDVRDNPFNPSSGSLNGIVVKYASDLFLSETDFIKGSFQSSWYFTLFKPLVFAFSLRGGAAYGFETEELPLIERFFLGGRSTVRGYRKDALGPKGSNGNPTGGNIFALSNWELRYSIGKGFGVVTFLDSGNVWKTFDDMDDELKYTVGAGLRYKTPVGPVRIDYGHKMSRNEGESRGEAHFSFGHAF